MNLRGRYEGGGMVVTAKRWWSPADRRNARLAARVLQAQGPQLARARAAAVRMAVRALVHGDAYYDEGSG